MHIESPGYLNTVLYYILVDVCDCILLFSTHTESRMYNNNVRLLYIDRAFRYISPTAGDVRILRNNNIFDCLAGQLLWSNRVSLSVVRTNNKKNQQ